MIKQNRTPSVGLHKLRPHLYFRFYSLHYGSANGKFLKPQTSAAYMGIKAVCMSPDIIAQLR